MTSELDRRTFVWTLAALAACRGVEVQVEPPHEPVEADPSSTFHTVYDDEELRRKFLGFYENVFRLYPPDKLHELVHTATQSHPKDAEIYATIVRELPTISPRARMLTLALPALAKQKRVMAEQTKAIVPVQTVDGYLEIGTVGRYYNAIKKLLPLDGATFVVNDTAPSKDPADIVERGQVSEVGTFVDLANYAPIGSVVPDASLDLVTNFIGFHHAPDDKLAGFIGGIRRVLRPGGTLVLREHDVVNEAMRSVVALAHDVFNAGTEVDWTGNQAEIRHFRSVAQWKAMLEGAGFQALPQSRKQDGDPTDNVLLAFRKV